MTHTWVVTPETHYAKSGEVHIAYQVVGGGPIDLVLIPGLFTHVEHQWDEPSSARFLTRDPMSLPLPPELEEDR